MAIAPRGLPIPPMPVMPPEGIAPVTDPASTGTAPDASPTTMVLQYLKARGFTPSSENVRRALEANQRDPGVIPGLRSDRPATEAEDQAAMRAAGVGGVGGRGLPIPPIPPAQPPGSVGTTPPMDRRDDTTSAAPSTNTSSSTPPPDADYSMPGWGTAAAGTGLALANAILNRTPSAQFVGNAQPASGKVTDVLPEILPNPSPMDASFARAGLGGPTITPTVTPPAPQITGPPPATEAPVAAPGSTVVTPPPRMPPDAVVRYGPNGEILPPSNPARATATPPPPDPNAPLPFSSQSPRRPPTPEEIAALARVRSTSTTLRGLGNAARVIPR